MAQYTELERRDALDILAINQNNIALTSHQTGIPQRTLRDWQRLQYIEQSPPPQPPSAAAAEFHERFPDKNDALEHIIDQCLIELTSFVDELPEVMRLASPYHRLLTFIHIIDRLDKLRTLMPPHPPAIPSAADGNDHPSPYDQRQTSDSGNAA